jgi:hypothetical protein
VFCIVAWLLCSPWLLNLYHVSSPRYGYDASKDQLCFPYNNCIVSLVFVRESDRKTSLINQMQALLEFHNLEKGTCLWQLLYLTSTTSLTWAISSDVQLEAFYSLCQVCFYDVQ